MDQLTTYPPGPAQPAPRPDASRLWSGARCLPLAGRGWLAAVAALALVLLIAAAVRLRDLPGAYGTLGVDEARLALVAQGLAEHGWPVLPTGKVYTRGLVPALLMIPSLKLLGPTDFGARLPSVLAGVALVGVTFLFARRLGGATSGLLAAALAAVYPPLVEWSRQAWLYSMLCLLWLLALYLADRAVCRDDRRAWALGLLAASLAVLTHELAVLLVPLLGLRLLIWARAGSDRSTRARFAALAGVPPVLALGLTAAFTLTLRSDTLAGRFGEVDSFLYKDLGPGGLGYYAAALAGGRGWLMVPGLLAVVVLADGPLLRRLVLPLASVGALLLTVAVLVGRESPEYVVAVTPTVLVTAALGAVLFSRRVAARLPTRLAVASVVGLHLLVLAAWLDPAGLNASAEVGWSNNPWIGNLYALGYRPGDLIMADTPTVAQFYLGRVDFWARSWSFEKYTTVAFDGRPRDIHTGALLVRDRSDFAEQVRDPNHGKVLWVIGSNRSPHWFQYLDTDLRRYLTQRADARKMPVRGPQIFMHRLSAPGVDSEGTGPEPPE